MNILDKLDRDIKIKWCIHRNYLKIIFGILFIAIILGVVLYIRGCDWKISLTIMGGLISFIYFIQKQQLDEAKLFNELFVSFNDRYNKLNEKLNNIIKKENLNKELVNIEDASQTLYDYFNLCSEEFLFYQKGFIYPEVWESWIWGMKEYYEDERIQNIWREELGKGSYYGFSIDAQINALIPQTSKSEDLKP
ncbi:hypothetical protein [Pseudanabaena minima]|uniref:hypothetical protein n=1 Tax=Pseudanabaena minima TaxID=890415 RepID=UPI003DA7B48C